MTTTTQPYHWLKRISPDLLKKDSIPLIGSSPPFPWESFSKHLSKNLHLDPLSIKPAKAFEWRSGKELKEGFGEHIAILNLTIAPLGGLLSWFMAKEDLHLLMALLLQSEASPQTLIDDETRRGFYHFIALEVINTIPLLDFDKNLTAHILPDAELSLDPSLCLDISISIKGRSFWGRIAISSDLHQKWKERYALRSVEAPLSREIDLVVRVIAGRVAMKLTEWSQIHPGDFIMMDSCTVHPNGEGKITLTIEDTPIFQGKISNGNINILESPLYREVDIEMDTKHPSDANPPNNSYEEEQNDPSTDEEFMENKELENDNEDFENGSNPENDGEDSEEEGVDEDTEEDFFEEDLEIEQEKWPPPPEKRPTPTPTPSPKPAVKAEVSKEEKGKPLSPEEIPLNIIVEVGRIQMSVQKLMELQPGNMLDLNLHPENGVDLVVNGKRIAKGELLLIGDMLGVRVIDIG